MKTAEILAVGSELLTPFRTDTNSLFLTARLDELGIGVRAKAIVGDDRGDLAVLFRQALERADLVLVTGGLGPTDDDVTREVVAGVLQRPLRENDRILEGIRARFAGRHLPMPEINRRQAMVPEGAEALQNDNGTAPGLWIEQGGRVVVLLPGPPRELQPIFERDVAPRLAARTGGARLYRRILRVTGRTESHVEEIAQPVYGRWQEAEPRISTTILAAPGQIELHLWTRDADRAAAEARLEAAVGALRQALGPVVFSVDGRSLEEVVGGLLRDRGWRIAVAESCTGGLVASRLTDVAGSSAYVDRAVVAYSNTAKIELLGVAEVAIREHGAVSDAVALSMAEGVRRLGRVEVGIGVTGIAGPTGGSPEKPVGTVVIAVAADNRSRVRRFWFPGGREQVKFQAVQAALDMVRRLVETESGPGGPGV